LAEKFPLSDEKDNDPAVVKPPLDDVTVIETVTVFAGDELSFTTTLVTPTATPETDSVAPLMLAVAIEELGAV
jgi:hypothetical protein